jgi:hypothetical protein
MKKIIFLEDWQGHKKDSILETKEHIADKIIKEFKAAKLYSERKKTIKKD